MTSPEAQRLCQYLRWAGPPNLGFGAIVISIYLVYPEPLILILGTLVGLQAVWVRIAYRFAVRDQVDRAILIQSLSLWAIVLALGMAGPRLFALTSIVALLPVIVAVPYVGLGAIRTMGIIGTVLLASCAVFFVVEPPFPLTMIPERVISWVLALGIPAVAVATALSLWHTRSTLREFSQGLESANVALQESKRSLDRKVRDRTAELEQRGEELAVARDAALEASRAKSTFLSAMSHELRTPLNAIIGYGEILHEEALETGAGDTPSDVSKILSSGRQLLTLVDRVLNLQSLESGEMALDVESFDVGKLIDETVASFRSSARDAGTDLRVASGSGSGSMVSDRAKVQQILDHLVGNAVKFTREGRVEVSLERSDEWLQFTVFDTGPGMSSKQLRQIFVPFSQWDSTDREFGGTGLGLAVTKQLCGLLGGTISVESELGKGSRFVVQLSARLETS